MSKKSQKKRVPKGGPSSLSGSPTPAPGAVPPSKATATPALGAVPPSKATVLDWVKKDLQSAHYLLGLVLQLHPEIVEEMANNVFDTVMIKANGSAIDHVGHAETGLD